MNLHVRLGVHQNSGSNKTPFAPELPATRDRLRSFCKARFQITKDAVELAFRDHRAHLRFGIEPPDQYVPLAMGLDPGDDFWPDVRACLAPDQNSEMLQPNPNLAWILNDTRTRCWHGVDKRFD